MIDIQANPDGCNVSELEVPPEESWFLDGTGPNGEKLVYLRFQATGLCVRRIGPFESRSAALEWLDLLVSRVCNEVDCELGGEPLNHGIVRYPWNRRHDSVFIEDPFIFKAPALEKTDTAFRETQSVT